LYWQGVSLAEGLYLFSLFNIIFVRLWDLLLIQFSSVVTLQIIYNVYFRHRGIPGSFWYKATDLTYPLSIFTPQGYFQIRGLRKLQKLHAELGRFSWRLEWIDTGDVIRIQPNHISFNTVHAIEDIHGARTKIRKSEPYATTFGSETKIQNLLSATYPHQLLNLP
jgi:hypothetical protein